ncbi:hypothetical protein IE81DRAFT_8097 [Ceraceosorus guamensis]|uniref:Uncharacterized protein n=1 Tax=Ceraceosorus guamensis TaxID=1522189 RepID=A0A316WFP0_9BASI|nr:hypothetical protein IE81DRAFT_8097 [Ceraceosorus guamensis]PWN46433.1 hypothetical protein IE81DRAFT_8097 [Ceraceosorus guamensis]
MNGPHRRDRSRDRQAYPSLGVKNQLEINASRTSCAHSRALSARCLALSSGRQSRWAAVASPRPAGRGKLGSADRVGACMRCADPEPTPRWTLDNASVPLVCRDQFHCGTAIVRSRFQLHSFPLPSQRRRAQPARPKLFPSHLARLRPAKSLRNALRSHRRRRAQEKRPIEGVRANDDEARLSQRLVAHEQRAFSKMQCAMRKAKANPNCLG